MAARIKVFILLSEIFIAQRVYCMTMTVGHSYYWLLRDRGCLLSLSLSLFLSNSPLFLFSEGNHFIVVGKPQQQRRLEKGVVESACEILSGRVQAGLPVLHYVMLATVL
eukprot:TRINITY_DN11207_c0_g1_i2.p1 TRINITY_DN11207_c0_g1~~TRINITY_DN11207_c0_g1_i2.p1  ORF type:complete len:109 (-),score=7.10 TRINITY_DN11207_c0_g1_i2:84-410(-)